MPATCENWPRLINSCVYYVRQTRIICQTLSCSMDHKAPGELWNPLGKAVLPVHNTYWNNREAK